MSCNITDLAFSAAMRIWKCSAAMVLINFPALRQEALGKSRAEKRRKTAAGEEQCLLTLR